jgi:two-component system, NtrC family, sensor histidine kinase HydH
MSGQPDAYGILRAIVHLSVSSLPLEAKLDRMLQLISEAFRSDRVLLLRPDRICENGFLSLVASGREALWVDEHSPFQGQRVAPGERELLSPAFACLPLGGEVSFVGILYLGFSKGRGFIPGEVDLLLSIAEELGRAIQNDNFRLEAERNIAELTLLHQLTKAAGSTLNPENLFESILVTGSKILKAKGGVLRIHDRLTKELRVRSSLGKYHENPFDEKISRRVFLSRTPFSLNHLGKEKRSLSLLSAPLLSRGRVWGTLSFYDKEAEPARFEEGDFQLLLEMTHQISSWLAGALRYDETSKSASELEKRVRQLSTLWELNKALLTTVNLERTLQMTLTAITIGEGLGFNRAILFRVNEKEQSLDGTMAVGPDNAEEAGKIWTTLSQKKGALSDRIVQLELSSRDSSALDSIVKGIRIPLERDQCILSRTVLEGKSFNVQLPRSEEGWLQTGCGRGCQLGSEVGCYIGTHLSTDPKVYSFAAVPLWGKGKVIGVIMVDNLYNRNPITEEDIQFLGMFSNQAGLAIENAILYRNLEEVHRDLKEAQALLVHQEKMVALGKLSDTIAHEIKNPLVSIGGFARRLYKAIPAEAPGKRYSQTIMIEVARLEKILNDLYNYTHDDSITYGEHDLREILEDSLAMISEGIEGGGFQLVKEYAEKIPKVKGDYQQLKQAFFNLIDNAYQAMQERGRLCLRVYPFSRNGSSYVRVEVEDTGKGIDPTDLHNIFNPFFSTRGSSLGLGLPTVHKIVNAHQGQIEVDNHPGKGVTFIITLPTLPA